MRLKTNPKDSSAKKKVKDLVQTSLEDNNASMFVGVPVVHGIASTTINRSDFSDDESDTIHSQEEKKINDPWFSGPWPSDPWFSDPWSSDLWWNDTAWTGSSNNPQVGNTFASAGKERADKNTQGGYSTNSMLLDPFEVAFGSATDIENNNRTASISKNSPEKSNRHRWETKIGVVVEERLSILFDESTEDPVCRVVGSIYVKPTKRKFGSFCLTIRDRKAHVEHWNENNGRCKNITTYVPHLALDPGDQVYQVTMNDSDHLEAPIVTYTCIPTLRPMPLVSFAASSLALLPIALLPMIFSHISRLCNFIFSVAQN
jgi:hypothetical protein